jgi:hypothetical protein
MSFSLQSGSLAHRSQTGCCYLWSQYRVEEISFGTSVPRPEPKLRLGVSDPALDAPYDRHDRRRRVILAPNDGMIPQTFTLRLPALFASLIREGQGFHHDDDAARGLFCVPC